MPSRGLYGVQDAYFHIQYFGQGHSIFHRALAALAEKSVATSICFIFLKLKITIK